MMDGILNINKPSGWTSHDVVQKVRGILREKRIGHTGTLDPMATGVLVLCAGRATRIAKYIEAGEKEYTAVMRLGIITDTQDADGRVIETRAYSPPAPAALYEALQRFTGTIMQRPPAFSAVKVAGVPSYMLAREGKDVKLEPKRITIHSIELLEYSDPFVRFHVRCTKGTYIRALCADVGAALGMGAHLFALQRTRSGRFRVEEAVTMEGLSAIADKGEAASVMMPIDEALADFPAAALATAEAAKVSHGNQVFCPAALANHSSLFARVRDHAGNLIAVARIEAGMLKPEVVFAKDKGAPPNKVLYNTGRI